MPHWSAPRHVPAVHVNRSGLVASLLGVGGPLGTGGVDPEHVLELLCQTPVAQAQVRPDPPRIAVTLWRGAGGRGAWLPP